MRYERDGFSVRSARKKRRPLPADHWFLNKPPRVPGADFFYTAYRDLGTCRPADGPIPWDRAMAYAERKRLKPDLADALWTIVSRMDTAERRWRLEQMEREASG